MSISPVRKEGKTESSWRMVEVMTAGSFISAASYFRTEIFDWANQLKKTRLYSGLILPLTLVNLTSHFNDLRAPDRSSKIDAGLQITTDLSSLFYHASNFMTGLKDLGFLEEWSVRVSDHLLYLSIPLQLGWLVFVLKEQSETKALYEKREKIIQFLKDQDDKYIFKQLNIHDVDGFRQKLNTASDPELQAITNRLVSKQLSERIALVAISVTLVASVAFLLSPASPLTYLLFTAGLSLDKISFLYDFTQ